MGITARGAWESVERHFREIEINIEKAGFTVIGIGDMQLLFNRAIREEIITPRRKPYFNRPVFGSFGFF